MTRRLVAILLIIVGAATSVLSQPRKPKLPPGRDPGGFAVALLTTGIDYTRREVADRLARDGEGELVGWDFVDNDNRPYAPSPNVTPANWGGDGTLAATRIAAAGTLRLVPIRIDPAKPVTLAAALAFAVRTPARILLMPMSSDEPEDWQAFRQAAQRFPDLIIVTSAAGPDGGGKSRGTFPGAFGLDNVIVVSLREVADADVAVTAATTGPALQPNPVTPVEVLAAFVELLPHCLATDAAGPAIANRKLKGLLTHYRGSLPPQSTTLPANMEGCRLRALRP